MQNFLHFFVVFSFFFLALQAGSCVLVCVRCLLVSPTIFKTIRLDIVFVLRLRSNRCFVFSRQSYRDIRVDQFHVKRVNCFLVYGIRRTVAWKRYGMLWSSQKRSRKQFQMLVIQNEAEVDTLPSSILDSFWEVFDASWEMPRE